MKKLITTFVATLGLLCLALAPSLAQNWPERPVRMIVPFPPGGGTDLAGRMMAKFLSERFNQSFFIENRSGANGAIALQVVKQSTPDGYTFAFTSDTPLTVNPWLYKDLSYDPLRDFIPVASVVRFPGMLVAHPSLPANNVAELIALAKQKPGSISYASAGVGNFSHLAMELFSTSAGVKLLHVPYKGTGPMAMAILGGEVQVEFNNVTTLLQYVQEGKVKALAVGEPQRIPELADLPTVAETVPGFQMAPWNGIVAPVGTPKAIIDRLSEATLAVMRDRAIAQQFTDQHLTVMALDQDQFAELIRSDLQMWGKVIKAAGIKME